MYSTSRCVSSFISNRLLVVLILYISIIPYRAQARLLSRTNNNGNNRPSLQDLRAHTQQILTTLTQAVYRNREAIAEYEASTAEDTKPKEESEEPTSAPSDDTNTGATDSSEETSAAEGQSSNNSTDDNQTDRKKRHCGCASCDQDIWMTVAPPGASSEFTCGARVKYLMQNTGMNKQNACREVASALAVCAPCNPDTCDGNSTETTNSTQPRLDPFESTFSANIYCYPAYGMRTVYEGVWDQGFRVEVKENDYVVCDPGSNFYSTETVHVSDDMRELTLEYKLVDGVWRASEVRVVLPDPDEYFSYGTYSWSIKTIETYDSDTGEILADFIDKDLVLGMFTWDDTANFTVRENFNHEVDIEISRFGSDTKRDVQFLVQPPELPHYHRFSSGGKEGVFHQGNGTTYQISWQPTRMDWWTDTAGGVNFTYTTQQALDAGLEDRIQCLPANVEIRINLWHFRGAIPLSEFPSNTTVTRVVIDDFQYVPMGVSGVGQGETCSKDCQCEDELECANNVCINASAR